MASVLGSLVSGAIGWLGGEQQNRRQADAAEAAQTFSAQQFATRYQTTVADMKAAGLNPMLAYSQGGGSPPSGVQANVPANSGAAAVSGYQAARVNKAQADLLEAQKSNVDEDTRNKAVMPWLTMAQTDAAGASASASRANVNFMETQAEKIKLELKNVPKEGDRLDALVRQLAASRELLLKQGLTQDQAMQQMKWLAVKTMHESDLAGLDVKSALAFDNIGRDAAQVKPILDLLKHLFPSRR